MTSGNLQSERYCVFRSGGNVYAIPAMSVQRLCDRPLLTRIPFSDPVLRGMSYSQSEFLPVFSLLSLTQVQYDQTPDSEGQMLVALREGSNWGLLIDETMGLSDLEISISTLSSPDDAWSKVIVGSASFQNNVLQVLDPEAIYQYAIGLLNGFWSKQEISKPSSQLVEIQG